MNRNRLAVLWLKRMIVGHLFLSAFVDLWPHFGPPHFRYTGSDLARAVWNFGWPIASYIYDAQTGLEVGPVAWVAGPLQVLILGAMLAAWYLLEVWHRMPRARGAATRQG
jgi:hypothetical protein